MSPVLVVADIGLLVVVAELLDLDHQYHQQELEGQVLVEEVLILVAVMQEILLQDNEMVLLVLIILVVVEAVDVQILTVGVDQVVLVLS